MDIKNKLKSLRIEKGWKQKELAYKLGVTNHTVYFWESGRSRPASSQRQKICKLFGISESSLFSDEAPPQQGKNITITIGNITIKGRIEYAN